MKENQTKGRVISYTRPYEEAHVSADLSQMSMLMLAALCDQVEQNKSYGELIQTKQTLEKFGLSSSRNAELLGDMSEQMRLYTEATDSLAFMEEVWDKFGKDVMVVRYDHFFQMLEKYDMVCGSFDRYTGAIPQEALDTLNRLSDMWEREEFSERYGMNLEYTIGLVVKDEVGIPKLIKRLRMPQCVSNTDVMRQIGALTGFKLNAAANTPLRSITDALFIAAPAADMRPISIDVTFRTPEYERLRNAQFPEPLPHLGAVGGWLGRRDAFLTDISEKMRKEEERLQAIVRNSGISRYANIKFIKEEPIAQRMLLDPFICSLTPFGVLIHAKWGAEAEDATIKRYEQLRDAIIGKGGAA